MTRWLPIQVDGTALLRDGAYTYECPDCAYLLHAVIGEETGGSPASQTP